MYIKCENVNKTIGKNVILKNVNLSLSGGCIYGLWGKNGSGKTMLMRMLAGLIRPTAGKVCIDGKELTHGFPSSMGILIENPDFLQEYTGFQNLKLLAGLRGVITDSQIRSTMEKIGLDPDDKRVFRKYSLGMRQRLGIACAVMESPELLLLDEPINALDVKGVTMVKKILEEEKASGALIVISCHDADEMEALADVIYAIEDGVILSERKGKDLKALVQEDAT